VSQPVLAGPNGVAYAQQLEAATQLALSSGFVLDISMQDQSRACGPAEPLPGPETEAAWATLLSNTSLSGNPLVMFELFNEPQNSPIATPTTDPQQSTWVDWLNGGRPIGPGKGWAAYTPVGHQALVNYLRNTLQVPNILIADGAGHAAYLEGLPVLQDPGGNNQIAYGVHPYYYTDGQPNWDLRWGSLASTNAVIATEWDYASSACGSTAQTMAPALLGYLRNTVNVGVLGQALDDYTGELIADSTLRPTQCGTGSPGGGKDFLTDYMATFTPTAVAAPVLTATAHGAREVDLSWTTPPDTAGIASYDLYRDGDFVATTTAATFVDPNVTPTTTYAYTVDANDTVGNVSPPSGVASATTGGALPPLPPTGLSAAYGSMQIRLSWATATDPYGTVAGYDVYRGGVLVATTTSTSFTDSSIAETTPYTYSVDAVDTAGDVSTLSAPLVATAPDDRPPSVPGGLKASLSTKALTLTWAPATDNVAVTGYRIYRNGAPVGTTPTRSYADSAVSQGNAYQYQVVAFDAAGNTSLPSAALPVVDPDTTKPSAPTKLTLTPAKASIALKWAAATDNVAVTGYRIYRGTTLITTVVSPTLGYTNTGLKTGTSYSYHLTAIDAAGNASASSAAVSAKAR
jgi:chitodextrinase